MGKTNKVHKIDDTRLSITSRAGKLHWVKCGNLIDESHCTDSFSDTTCRNCLKSDKPKFGDCVENNKSRNYGDSAIMAL